jgi:hypothetical protein
LQPTARATSCASSSCGTTVQPVLSDKMLVWIAIKAINASVVNAGQSVAKVGLNKAPNPYVIAAQFRSSGLRCCCP